MEEEEDSVAVDEGRHRNLTSPEIVEIEEESRSIRDGGGASDVYVAVGKHDLHVVKCAIDHAVSPGSRVFLVHVFAPVTYITTPGAVPPTILSASSCSCLMIAKV